MTFTPLADLQEGQRGCKIMARVARIWDSTNPADDDRMMSLDFLLVDDKGGSIQGTAKKEDAPRIRESLKEGKIFTLANFVVAAAKNKFRVCKHTSMLRIGTWTIIKETPATDMTIPMNTFDLIKEDMIESRLHNDIFLTDMIGELKKVGPLEPTYANGRMVPKRNLKICTLRMTEFTVTLWGVVAEVFDTEEASQLGEKEPVIAILSAMTVRSYKAKTTLSSTSATKIYLNFEIEEVFEFRKLISNPNYTNTIRCAIEDESRLSIVDTPTMKTVIELLLLDKINDKGKKFNCSATIIDFDNARGWSYNACAKCKSGVSTVKGNLICRSCGPITSLPIPWYKINMIVSDGTADTKFQMFGRHVERLLKISAANLSELPGSDKNVLPPVVQQLQGKRLTFTVSINDREENPSELTFNVSQAITEPMPIRPEIVNNEAGYLTYEAESSIITEKPVGKTVAAKQRAIVKDDSNDINPLTTKRAKKTREDDEVELKRLKGENDLNDQGRKNTGKTSEGKQKEKLNITANEFHDEKQREAKDNELHDISDDHEALAKLFCKKKRNTGKTSEGKQKEKLNITENEFQDEKQGEAKDNELHDISDDHEVLAKLFCKKKRNTGETAKVKKKEKQIATLKDDSYDINRSTTKRVRKARDDDELEH